MDLTGYLGLGRGLGLQRAMDVLANNIANVDTTGFRRQDLVFEESLERAGEPGRVAFGEDHGTAVDRREGPLRATGGMLDLALVGAGWFQVNTPDGTRLTRAGRFVTDGNGTVVNSQAEPVLDDSGSPLSVPVDAQTIAVAQDGTVSADQVVVGKVGVFDLPEGAHLVPEGAGTYRTDAALSPVADAQIVQGSLEGSNVQPIMEMTRLIEVTRAFESTQKLLETHHDLARRTVDRMLSSQS